MLLTIITTVHATCDQTTPTWYWKLNETTGNTAVDAMNVYNATGAGTMGNWTSAGKIGYAYAFNRTALQYFTINSAAAVNWTINWTITAWIYAADAQTDETAILSHGGSGHYEGMISRNGAGLDSIVCYAGSADASINTNFNYRDGKWRLYACVYNGTHIRAYVNGTLNVTGTATGNTAYANMEIGDNGGYPGTKLYKGKIDDLRLYKKILNTTELTAIYNSGTGCEWTANATTTSCTYGGSGTWNINCADNCTITNNYALNNNTITATGGGTIINNANITQFSTLRLTNACKLRTTAGNKLRGRG